VAAQVVASRAVLSSTELVSVLGLFLERVRTRRFAEMCEEVQLTVPSEVYRAWVDPG
jgi:hypothetical protein